MSNVITIDSDQPKTTKEQDALGFSDSAESVAKIILDSEYPDGFVIGIEGEWGSGKTTYINLIRESLKEQSPEFKIIEFKPWLHSNQENLITAYFKLLSEETAIVFSKNKNIKKAFANITDIINFGTAAFAGVTGNTVWALPANKLMRSFSKLLRKLPTLESEYESIQHELTKAKTPFLVIIDDLDRLDSDEIKTMLKLVKSVGKLPYVTYILAYDREYVTNATNADMPDKKTSFLEKIVQLPIPIPKPPQSKLFTILNNELKDFFETIPDNNKRWQKIIWAVLRPSISKPREVTLLTNSINFRFLTVKNILDPVDFFALEYLRLFDNKLWDWIKNNNDIIFGEGDYLITNTRENEFKQELETSLLELNPLSKNQRDALSLLFPRLAHALGVTYPPAESMDNTRKRSGIAVKSVYDVYFSQHLDENEVLQHNIDDFIKNSHDKEKTMQTLQEWIGKRDASGFSKIGDFLNLLDISFNDRQNLKPNNILLWALIDICDDINSLENPSGFLMMQVDWQLLYTFRILFQKIGQQKTNTFLQELCKDKERVSAASFLLHYVGHHMGKIQRSNDDEENIFLVEESDWKTLTEIISPHIQNAFLTGTVGNFTNVVSAEFLAAHIFDDKPANTMFKKAYKKSEQYVIKSIKGHLNKRILANGNTRYVFKKTEYPKLFDYNVLAEHAEKIDLEKQNEKTNEAVKLFIKGVHDYESLTRDQRGMF